MAWRRISTVTTSQGRHTKEVAAALAEVTRLAERIVANPAVAIGAGKKMFYRQLELDLESAYDYAGKVMAENVMADATREGISAFLEKREPAWRKK